MLDKNISVPSEFIFWSRLSHSFSPGVGHHPSRDLVTGPSALPPTRSISNGRARDHTHSHQGGGPSANHRPGTRVSTNQRRTGDRRASWSRGGDTRKVSRDLNAGFVTATPHFYSLLIKFVWDPQYVRHGCFVWRLSFPRSRQSKSARRRVHQWSASA